MSNKESAHGVGIDISTYEGAEQDIVDEGDDSIKCFANNYIQRNGNYRIDVFMRQQGSLVGLSIKKTTDE